MSAITLVGAELLYAYGGASTNLATFTTEDSLLKTYPLCKLPDLGRLLAQVGDYSSSLKIRAMGQAGAVSASTPSYTFSLRALTSATWSAGGILLGSSTPCVCASGVTKGIWQIDLDLVLRTLPVAGATTCTVACGGTVTGSAFTSQNSVPPAGTDPIITTLDTAAQYYLFLSAACSASNAANLINTQLFKLYGEN